MMRLSLELRHLPTSHLKGVAMPLLRTVPSERPAESYGGYYVTPRESFEIETGEVVDARRGLIVVVEHHNNESTVTHEFRHHLQSLARWEEPGYRGFSYSGNYESDICAFFSRSGKERDALRYELEHCPTDVNRLWAEWLKISAA